MCEICGQIPCHPRCPNAPEPTAVKKCCKCGGGIYEGDKYLETTDGSICEDCLGGFTVDEWLDIMGESLTTAEREDY